MSTRPVGSDRHRARRALGGLVAALVAAAGLAAVATAPVSGQAAPGVEVTGTPLVALEDGASVTVTIKTGPDADVYEAKAQLCRAGVSYQPGENVPNADFLPGGPNCPSTPISTSADRDRSVDAIRAAAKTPEGASFDYRVGIGVVEWDSSGTTQRLTCDPDNDCALVVQVYGGPGPTWQPYVLPLKFGAIDAIAGCGGAAPELLKTGASDRFTDAYVGLTLDECERNPGRGALTGTVYGGEERAVAGFAEGRLDLAYTGLGYDAEAAFVADEADQRAATMVPIGLNAVVLAVAGGHRLPTTGLKVPYQNIEVTGDELARLVTGGQLGIQPVQAELEARNPELAAGMFDNDQTFKVGASSEQSIVPFLMSRFLVANEAESFTVPDLEPFAPSRGLPRGVTSSFAVADPSYAAALEVFGGRPVLRRAISVLSRSSSGGLWVITDLATARAMKMAVVTIRNADGVPVGANDASMAAAAARLTEDEAGVLVPDPAMAGDVDGVVPYPLTFVEYAMVPSEPLVTADCVTRPKAQANLTAWLDHLVGPGQAALPSGIVALPPDLAADAATAAATVGEAEVTGECAGKVTEPTDDTPTTTTTTQPLTPPTTAPVGDGGDGGGGGGGGGSGGGGSSSNRVQTAAPAPTPTAVPGPSAAVSMVEDDPAAIPGFGGRSAAGWAGVVIALLVIMALTSFVSVVTARAQPGGRPGGGGPSSPAPS